MPFIVSRQSRNSTRVIRLTRGLSTALPGRATQAATVDYAKKHPVIPFSIAHKTGWNLSRIGFGGFRINEVHEEVVKDALKRGINVLDSSANFGNGASERAIGVAVRKLVEKCELKRENVVLVTKVGYLNQQTAQSYSLPRSTYIRVNNANMLHTIDPLAIEQSITGSLERLGVETIDVFMINNPERMMAGEEAWARAKLYDGLQKAFRYLDKEVARGRVATYGVCSNPLFVHSAPDHIPLSTLLEIADNTENFVAVQAPFNIFEREAVGFGSPADEDNYEAREITKLIKKRDLYLFTNRPLNAIARGQICTLANVAATASAQSEQALQDTLMTEFESIIELETEISVALSMNQQSLASKFVWGQILAENLAALSQNGFAARHYVQTEVALSVEGNLAELERYAAGLEDRDVAVEYMMWAEKYRDQTNTLIASLIKYIAAAMSRQNDELDKVLAATAPTLAKDGQSSYSPLSVKALRVILAGEGIGTVLVGMRKKEYVSDALLAAQLSFEMPLDKEEFANVLASPLVL